MTTPTIRHLEEHLEHGAFSNTHIAKITCKPSRDYPDSIHCEILERGQEFPVGADFDSVSVREGFSKCDMGTHHFWDDPTIPDEERIQDFIHCY